jgi:hypothetical protein
VGFKRKASSLPNRIARAHKSKARTHLLSARARFQIEQLETRVLLFMGPVSVSFPIFPVGVDSPQTFVSLIPPIAISDARAANFLPPATGEGGQAVITPFDPAHLADSTQDASSTLFLVNQNVGTGYSVAGSADEGRWQDTPQPSVVSSSQSSVISTFNAGSLGMGELGTQEGELLALAEARYSRVLLLAAGAEPFGPGIEANGNESTSLPAFDIATAGLTGFTAGHESLDGTYDPARPLMPFMLSMETGAELFPYQDHAGGPGAMPDISSGGGGPADSGEASAIQTGPPPNLGAIQFPAMNLARSTPIPVHLMGKVSGSPNFPTTESGTPGVTSANSSESFGATVLRQDDPDSTSAVTAPAQGPLAVGFTSFSDSTFSVIPPTLDNAAQSSAATTADTAQPGSEETAAVVAAFDRAASGSLDGFDTRIPTGPLASRNAGPLGPILASTGGDPTPEVDRDERAMYQTIERGESEAGNNQDAPEYLSAAVGSSEDAPGDLGGSVAVVLGTGGFPLKVTALPRNRTTELGGLLSSIRAGSGISSAPEDAAPAARSVDPGQVAGVASNRDDSPAFAVFIKAACGIALGLGMSSRAFFPTLLTRAQKRIRTRMRNLRSNPSHR